MGLEVVLVFGDSIAMGLWDDHGGWPAALWPGRSRIVYNLGVDGNTSEDVRKRFYSEAKSRGANRKSVMIFAVGVNDSSRMNGENRVNLTDYVHNMEGLVKETRDDFTERIFCVGLGPINQSKSVPFILEKTISFFSADQRNYDMALKELCNKNKVRYIPLRDLKLENHLSDDGVHPLPSGHAIIAKHVLEAITQRV